MMPLPVSLLCLTMRLKKNKTKQNKTEISDDTSPDRRMWQMRKGLPCQALTVGVVSAGNLFV